MAKATADKPADKKQKAAKKASNRKLIIGGVVVVLALVIYIGAQPLKGSIRYGICQVFIEQTLTYPPEMQMVSVLERGNEVRLEYSYMNEFGHYMIGAANCMFRQDPAAGYEVISDLTLNRQKVPAARLAIFNTTIPYIMAHPPSLVLPPRMPMNLRDLRR